MKMPSEAELVEAAVDELMLPQLLMDDFVQLDSSSRNRLMRRIIHKAYLAGQRDIQCRLIATLDLRHLLGVNNGS